MRWSPKDRGVPIPDIPTINTDNTVNEPPYKNALSTTGSLAQRAYDAIEFSEESRQRASDRRADLTRTETAELRRRHSAAELRVPTRAQIATAVDARVGQDALWRSYVSDEQWGLSLAETYAALVTMERTQRMIELLGQVLDTVRTDGPGA
jgi:hypothetical protein